MNKKIRGLMACTALATVMAAASGCAEFNYAAQSLAYGSNSTEAFSARMRAGYGSSAVCSRYRTAARTIEYECDARENLNAAAVDDAETALRLSELERSIKESRRRAWVEDKTSGFRSVCEMMTIYGNGTADVADSLGNAAESTGDAVESGARNTRRFRDAFHYHPDDEYE